MKILVDENIPFAEESFGQHAELIRFQGRSLKAKDMVGIDALITRSVTKVNAKLFAQHKPAFVGTCTIGIDHLDIKFLGSQNIGWAYAPGCNAQSVVDYVLSCLAVLNGDNLPKTVGVVGCGNVGGRLRKRLKGLGVDVVVYDPFLSAGTIPELTTLDQVFKSEVVCLHTPITTTGTDPTANMIGLQHLEYLPKNAMLISAGRGGVIVESDLLAFMDNRPDVSVVLDVWAGEPRVNAELLQRVNIATPHIAGYSLEGKRNGTEMIYKAFCQHFGISPKALQPLASAGSFDDKSFLQALLHAYDPREDSARMISRYIQASETEQASATWFDELRKNYPDRREFASFDQV